MLLVYRNAETAACTLANLSTDLDLAGERDDRGTQARLDEVGQDLMDRCGTVRIGRGDGGEDDEGFERGCRWEVAAAGLSGGINKIRLEGISEDQDTPVHGDPNSPEHGDPPHTAPSHDEAILQTRLSGRLQFPFISQSREDLLRVTWTT